MRKQGILAAAGLIALSIAARADNVVDPSTDPGAFANAGTLSWAVPCDYEYGPSAISGYNCGGDYELNQSSFTSSLSFPTGGTDNVTFSGVPGSVFAFQEVDTTDQYGNATEQIDSVIADNANCIPGCFGPITFSFSTDVTGFFTNIYSWGSFTATVSAYDASGNLLGSTVYSSTEYDDLLYFSLYQPTYAATVGVLDTTAPDIASVVISTTATGPGGVDGAFGIGTVDVDPALASPEPATFLLIGASLVAFWVRTGAGNRLRRSGPCK